MARVIMAILICFTFSLAMSYEPDELYQQIHFQSVYDHSQPSDYPFIDDYNDDFFDDSEGVDIDASTQPFFVQNADDEAIQNEVHIELPDYYTSEQIINFSSPYTERQQIYYYLARPPPATTPNILVSATSFPHELPPRMRLSILDILELKAFYLKQIHDNIAVNLLSIHKNNTVYSLITSLVRPLPKEGCIYEESLY